MISIIILSYNTRQLLDDCLEHIYRNTNDLNIEIIVVDNNSSDDSVLMVKEKYPEVRLIENKYNVGFAKGNNQGFQLCKGEYVLLLNSDALITPGSIKSLLNLIETRPKAGIVGARLINLDGTFQASHTPFPTLWQELLILSTLGRKIYHSSFPSKGPEIERGSQIVDYVEGACMLIRRQAYIDTGGLDETFFMYSEDVEICYKAKEKGWEVWYEPVSAIIHLGGASSKTRKPRREADLYCSRVYFFRSHYGNNQARLLKIMILLFLVFKIPFNKILSLISKGKYGRPVVSWDYLFNKFKGI